VVALPGLAQRLERELKQLERVQSGGVARVLGSGKRGDDSWVALELLDGAQTLADAVVARGPMPLPAAAHLIAIIGEALIEAAQVGVVHRDLAPKNILFCRDDVKLVNFSLPVPTSDKVPGVPEFVAPEQHDGKPVDQRSNLYSLGALYHFVLTGLPVQSDGNGVLRPPSSLADVPGPVETVILRVLDRSPTKRYLTVRQFVDEVGRVARGEPGVRSTQPLGRAGGGSRPPAELIQTLVDAHPAGDGAGTGTILGVGTLRPAAPASGAVGPAMPAPLPPVVPGRSPWAPPGSSAPDAPVSVQAAAAAPSIHTAATAPVAALTSPVSAPPAPPAPLATSAGSSGSSGPGLAPPIGAGPLAVPAPLAPPVVAPLLGSKKVGNDPKGKFRETMWFKKGELDSQAAQAAAEEHALTGKHASDKVDQLPIDERYKDDGSLSRTDKELYSLRTGGTLTTGAVRDSASHSSTTKVSEDALIGEMKGGRNKVFAIIAVAVVAVVLLILLIAR
jgi:serine/threonine-protein kinase